MEDRTLIIITLVISVVSFIVLTATHSRRIAGALKPKQK